VEPIYRFYGHLISLKIVVVVVETLMMYEDGSLWDQLFGMNELLFLVGKLGHGARELLFLLEHVSW
jgi:hypothetical protein